MTCKDCPTRSECKKPCRKIEKELKKVTVSQRNNKVTIIDPQYMDKVVYVGSECGKRKARIRYDDNWEQHST